MHSAAIHLVIVHDEDAQIAQIVHRPSPCLWRSIATRRRLLTVIEPPMSSTSCLEIVRPSPVPPYFLVEEPSTWLNFSNTDSSLPAGIPGPVSCTEIRIIARAISCDTPFHCDHDIPAERELDGVAHQVGQHLANPSGIPLVSRPFKGGIPIRAVNRP